MNDLLKDKEILEGKIALSKKLIATNEMQTLLCKEEMEWLNDSWVKLHSVLWKEQTALDAINAQLNPIEEEEIPTLALQKRNPVFSDYSKYLK